MILTDSDELAEQRQAAALPRVGRRLLPQTIGYCSRLDGLQAALLRVKARRLTTGTRRGGATRRIYDARARATSPGAWPCPAWPTATTTSTTSTPARPRTAGATPCKSTWRRAGVQSAVYYPLSLHLQEAYLYLGYQEGDLPESERATREVLSLPVHPDLREEQVEYAAECVRGIFRLSDGIDCDKNTTFSRRRRIP